MKLAANQEN